MRSCALCKALLQKIKTLRFHPLPMRLGVAALRQLRDRSELHVVQFVDDANVAPLTEPSEQMRTIVFRSYSSLAKNTQDLVTWEIVADRNCAIERPGREVRVTSTVQMQ